jgi:hypothetical protein
MNQGRVTVASNQTRAMKTYMGHVGKINTDIGSKPPSYDTDLLGNKKINGGFTDGYRRLRSETDSKVIS